MSRRGRKKEYSTEQRSSGEKKKDNRNRCHSRVEMINEQNSQAVIQKRARERRERAKAKQRLCWRVNFLM